ncbi:DUF2684 family protein [Buttiauxella izardii]|uniref:DUF2684 family protein n=1 Tax=Buttiauxella izardii TaxID=82991 RepID=A0A3A5K3A5_9ENTR|nr:DUF2684 family protein [Buttiauxella izardii]
MKYGAFAAGLISGSLTVNQYRWINIWTAILGYPLIRLPVIFAPASLCG